MVSERLLALKRGWPVPDAAWQRLLSPRLSSRPPGSFLLLHEGAVALVDGAEGLLGRDRRARLVVVPRAFGLGRLLHLEEIGGVDLAAVGADAALAEQRIVRRHLLHLRDDLGAVVA